MALLGPERGRARCEQSLPPRQDEKTTATPGRVLDARCELVIGAFYVALRRM